MDDSDLEHQHLREKRMRKPARLWRSARERAVWLRMARDATTAYEAAYCTYILCDRCGVLGALLRSCALFLTSQQVCKHYSQK